MKTMKRVLLYLFFSVLCILLLTGCSCEHDWVGATCTTPGVCSLCGERESVAPGHDWYEATCESPGICKYCNKIEGEALGHQWEEATCSTPKMCGRCETKIGNPLGHKWETKVYSIPAVCTVCYNSKEQSAYDTVKEYLLESGSYNIGKNRYEIQYRATDDVYCFAHYLPQTETIELSCQAVDVLVTLYFEENGDSTIPWLYTIEIPQGTYQMRGKIDVNTYPWDGKITSYDESSTPFLAPIALSNAGNGMRTLCLHIKNLLADIGISAYDMGFSNYK